MSQSVISVAQGGVHYDAVANGSAENYCFNLTSLIMDGTFEEHVNQLIESVAQIIHDIEIQSERTVAEFIIGKTVCLARANVNIDRTKVMNAYNWRVSSGPANRWNKSYKGIQQGMVVICGVTHDQVPLNDDGQLLVHQSQYALALEQALTHEFLLKRKDARCSNVSFTSGKTASEANAAIGVVYVVFQFADE